jgi:hypothetical protein
MKNTLLDTIVNLEWNMFSNVNNKGGKAACQMDLLTFRIMRHSQTAGWDEALLESYLDDLRVAKAQGRNLMSEKYARMMESTFHEEYVLLADRLPPVDTVAAQQVEEIVRVHVEWKEALDAHYPHLGDRGRPTRTVNDTTGLPSLETYMRAELKTLSPKTIALYHTATMERVAGGRSEAEEILLSQVQQYGYDSLDIAEAFFSRLPAP